MCIRDSTCGYQWERLDCDTSEISAIQGSNKSTYTSTVHDAGKRLRCCCTPRSLDGQIGEAVFTGWSNTIKLPVPAMAEVTLSGQAKEGKSLTAVATFEQSRTVPGGCLIEYQWTVAHPDKNSPTKPPPKQYPNKPTLQLTVDESGHNVACSATPVCDGQRGMSVASASKLVLPAEPRASQCTITEQSGTYKLGYRYRGGVEGLSQFQWYRKPSPDMKVTPSGDREEWPITAATGASYRPTADDDGCLLQCRLTPVREDGVQGIGVVAGPCKVNMFGDTESEARAMVARGSCELSLSQVDGAETIPKKLQVFEDRLKIQDAAGNKTEAKGSFSPQFKVHVDPVVVTRLTIQFDPTRRVEFEASSAEERDRAALVIRAFIASHKGN
eukprot:TRINITY_DN21018_c0_g1_i2.p1 TRINITY_DN21018_c0_g1~~TRINITY_DN21018_c0_g1_i2.p1  ORF type:complete len:385 (+),score=74.51 TRINITY_DN21018_c0_g1_i2:106-1260(+)